MTAFTSHAPTLLVHGGAWAIPPEETAAHEAGVREALETGYAVLSLGGSALDAVEAAVSILEDDPVFDAGRGSFLTSDGRVQLDALLMDGGRMKAGGVACVERLRNPIQAARLVLERSPHIYLVGPGAEQFVHSHGMTLIENSELVLERERERLAQAQAREAAGLADESFSGGGLNDDKEPKAAIPPDPDIRAGAISGEGSSPGFDSHDTVGAVALDAYGNLAAATSTGGTLNKTPGRVGDSSLIGCGCYADNLSGRRLAYRLGRADYEAGAGQVGHRPRGWRDGSGGGCAGGDRISLQSAGWAWRNYSARSGWALWIGAQYTRQWLGGWLRRAE